MFAWCSQKIGSSAAVRGSTSSLTPLFIAAADKPVHPVVRLRLNPTMRASPVLEASVDTAEARSSPARHTGEVRIGQGLEIHVGEIDVDVAVVSGP